MVLEDYNRFKGRNCRKQKKIQKTLEKQPGCRYNQREIIPVLREGFPLSKLKKVVSLCLSGITGLMIVPFAAALSLDAHAASFDDINAPEVFAKQEDSVTCTLSSNVMMLRRAAMLRGDSDWDTITEAACKPELWYPGQGMYIDYTYRDFKVTFEKFASDPESEMKEALSRHPEGVVGYDYDYPHAILVTDYTNGKFYCADPARNTPSGRITNDKCLVSVKSMEGYWFIESPSLSFSDGGSPVQEKEYWRITSDNGVNLRAGTGTGYTSYGVVPYKTLITVTQVKHANGYLWGKTVYDSHEGWVALDYAEKLEFAAMKNTSNLNVKTLKLGESLKVSGIASGGSGQYEYCYAYRRSIDSFWTSIKDYSSTKAVRFTPRISGSYVIRVKVHDKVTGEVIQKGLTFSVGNNFTVNGRLSSDCLTLHDSVTVKASAKGGKGSYLYAFYARKLTDKGWYTIQSYSSANSVSYTPAAAADYEFMIRAKDESGRISDKLISLTVDKPLSNRSKAVRTSIVKGESMKLTGAASGGSGVYEYAYYCRKKGSTGWYTIASYSDSASAEYTPVAAVTYEVMIRVRDSLGRVSEKQLEVRVDTPLINRSSVSSDSIRKGSSIIFKGAASGGSGSYQYAYYCRKKGSTGWYTVSSYSGSVSAEYTPVAAVQYEAMVRVKDSCGRVSEKLLSFTVR